MNNSNTDVMQYLPHMQVIDSDMMQKTLQLVNEYDYNKYTDKHVLNALSTDTPNLEDYAALLSPSAELYLEQMAHKALQLTKKRFGNSICLFTPLYIANYCENHCVYCGFNCHNKIKRARLTIQEIEAEMQKIASTGLKEILILTGEARNMSSVEYIGQAVEIAKQYFSTIGIEIYPLNSDEYAYLKQKGADFVSVYQETYNPVKYAEQHLSGSKRVFSYRFYSQERALMGGMRGVNLGALLGLDDFRKDAYAVGVHASLLQKKYPSAEIGFSVPRIRPYINNKENNSKDVRERQLLQVMLAYRIFMPSAGITISTRENQKFRDNVVGMVATKISAGVKVGVGGHESQEKGDEQFDISDPRGVDEVVESLKQKGLQAVFSDTSYL